MRANLDGFVGAVRVDQHPSEARMEWKTAKLPKIAELCEQRDRGVEAIFGRPFEPFECFWITSPRDDVERGRREIDAADLRFAMRTKNVALIPQPHHTPGPRPPGPPGALVGRIARDAFEHQMIDR